MLRKFWAVPLLMLPLYAMAAESDTQRLTDATKVLDELMNAGDKSIPGDLFQKAYCVVVIPTMKKGGFIFSGKYGRGFASCRNPGGVGRHLGPCAWREADLVSRSALSRLTL
jgi:lipid-binding SYLF domain-containing protein